MIPKYRAYIKSKNKIYEVISLCWDSEGNIGVELDVNGHWSPINMKGIELMQWTGLVDSDGNEIWEGDILRYSKISAKPDQIYGVVKWDYARFYCIPNHSLYIQAPLLCVAGNRYLNPELLEGADHDA